MTIKRITLDESADGRRIATVCFGPHVPDPALQPDVDVVFEIYRKGGILDDSALAVVGPISSTVVDTRETYTLSKSQKQMILEALLAHDLEDW